jgi:DNA repair protein RecO (recombination protein O)
MDLLTEAKLERRFRSAGKDLERLYGAYYVVELLNGLTDNGDPNPELFELASQTLCELDEGPESPFRTCLRFEFAMLQMVGHTPMLNQCVYCGEEMSDEKRVFFGALAGGLICPRCRPGKTGVISLSKQAWNLMSNFLSSEEEQVREEHEPFESSQRNVGGIAEVRETMNQFVSHLLGRRPRLQAYLKVPVSDPTTRRDNKKRLSHVSATNSRMTGNRQPRAQDESSP